MTVRKTIETGGDFSDAESESLKTKVGLVMDMSGRDDHTKLAVLSYALVFTAVNAEVEFSSIVRTLATVYEDQFNYKDEGDEQ